MSRKKFKPPVCPYCEEVAALSNSKLVYGKSYGPIWLCVNYPKCDSYVGCHPGGRKPLGRLADKELRQWKMRVHRVFDPLWKRDGMDRTAAYKWLAETLGLSRSKCHVGMFDVETCWQAVRAVEEFRAARAVLVSDNGNECILKCPECEFTSEVNDWDIVGAEWDEICCPQCNAVLKQPAEWTL